MVSTALIVALAVACASAFPLDEILAPNAVGQNWAVLVAGSNSWGNYRHQVYISPFFVIMGEFMKSYGGAG